MSDMVKEYFENSLDRPQCDDEPRISSDVLAMGGAEDSQNPLSDPSTYTLASDQSQMSRDVDLWLRGATATTGIQISRVPLAQRSASANIPMTNNGMWYALALLLPFLSINNYPHWRCSPSTFLHTAEVFVNYIGRACDRVRGNIRRVAHNQMSREFTATVMDALLVIYAIGFLVISLYQASIIG